MELIYVGGGTGKVLDQHEISRLFLLLFRGNIIPPACFLDVDCSLHGEDRSVDCRPAPFYFVSSIKSSAKNYGIEYLIFVAKA